MTSNANHKTRTRSGIIAAFACYALWGSLPLYWKLLGDVNSLEVIAHRVIWCFVFTVVICLIARMDFMSLLRQPRARRFLIPAAIIVTCNWGLYIFAVDIDRIVETAIGYYLNPLVSIILGVIVFKERLSPLKAVATCLCAIGLVCFTFGYGSFPWIAVLLALTFGVYGAIKKKGGYPAIEAVAVENTIMVIPALLIAAVLASVTGSHGFLGDVQSTHGWATTLLLIGGGLVTAVPLILFARAANLVPLTIMGFIQYISPTLALLLGVFVNGEPFTLAHGLCLGFIWAGLVLVMVDTFRPCISIRA